MLHMSTIGVPGYCAGNCAGPGALAPSARSARFGPRSGGRVESALAVASLTAKALWLAIRQKPGAGIGCCAGRALAGPPSCRFAHRKATWPWAEHAALAPAQAKARWRFTRYGDTKAGLRRQPWPPVQRLLKACTCHGISPAAGYSVRHIGLWPYTFASC